MHFRRARKAPKRATEIKMWSADEVWAAACAAQHINGGYFKVDHTDYDEEYKPVKATIANRAVMRMVLLEPEFIAQVTDADRQRGKEIREYWQAKLMEVLAGTANSFTKQAVNLSGLEQFRSDDWLNLAIVAALPNTYERSLARDARVDNKREALYGSQHFGTVGDKVSGELTVLDSVYSEKWGTNYVTAQFGTNVILFTYRSKLEAGAKFKFNGTIKNHRDENITQLNRVRLG